MDLSWLASSDNVKVTEYAVKRDGKDLGSTERLNFTDRTSLEAGKTYNYSVSAKDATGNKSSEGSLNLSTSCSFLFCSIRVL